MERNRNPKTCVITLNGSTTEVKKEKLEEQKVTISHNRKLSTCTTEKEAAKKLRFNSPQIDVKVLSLFNFDNTEFSPHSSFPHPLVQALFATKSKNKRLLTDSKEEKKLSRLHANRFLDQS